MAAANLDTNKLAAEYNNIKALTFTALDATDGGVYTPKNRDGKTIIIIHNTDGSNAENVTIKAPTKGALGVGTGFPDKQVSVAANKIAVAFVETMRYLDPSTGKVKLAGSADVKVAVVEI